MQYKVIVAKKCLNNTVLQSKKHIRSRLIIVRRSSCLEYDFILAEIEIKVKTRHVVYLCTIQCTLRECYSVVLYTVYCTMYSVHTFMQQKKGDAILVLEAKQASHVHSKIILQMMMRVLVRACMVTHCSVLIRACTLHTVACCLTHFTGICTVQLPSSMHALESWFICVCEIDVHKLHCRQLLVGHVRFYSSLFFSNARSGSQRQT